MNTTEETPAPANKITRFLKWLGFPILVLLIGVVIAGYFKKTAPHTERKVPPRAARLVEVLSVQRSDETVTLHAVGTVIPAREVHLQPRVSGQVVEVSPNLIPGGYFAAGEMLAKLEPTDYALALRQRESELLRIQSDLALEQGQQTIAARELELLGQKVSDEDRDLVLRKPQLDQIQAQRAVAEAAVEKACLDLERCTITAPFNAMIRSRGADVGMQVTPNTAIATLVGSDAYWIEVPVRVDQLRWIHIPDATHSRGSAVTVSHSAWGDGVSREGTVLRLLSGLEEQGRMASLLIEVQDPLARLPAHAGLPRMLLGEYVNVEIEGKIIPQVIALPRELLRDDDTVWVMNEQGQLNIRPVTIQYRGVDTVVLKDGLNGHDQVVASNLSSPVESMPLRLSEENLPASNKDPQP